MRTKTSLCLLIFSSVMTLVATACGEPAQGSAPAVVALPVVQDERYVVCGFRFDGTRSESPQFFTKTVDKFAEELPTVVDVFDCTAVRLSLFLNNAGFARTQEFRIPEELVRVPEKNAEPRRPQLTDKLKVAREYEESETKKHEDERRAKITAAQAKLVNDARGWIKDNIRLLDAPCTAVREFVDALNHGLTVADVDIVITDARDTCSSPPTSPIVLGHPVVFIVLPTVGDIHQTAAEALQSVRVLDKVYINSYALMAYEIDSPLAWRELKHRINTQKAKKGA